MRTTVVLIVLFFCSAAKLAAQAGDKPNFIFIVIDDLNDYIEGYTDQPQLTTPNIKAIAEQGTLFLNSYSNAAGCAPSRTSFFSGKDLAYTQVYNNDDYVSKFRENFTAEKNNALVYSLPEILKDSGGYFTYGINKLFHNPSSNDFDKPDSVALCEKKLSWNNMVFFEDEDSTLEMLSSYAFGNYFDWGMIPDSLETILEDYKAADSAIAFIESIANGTANTCGNPFFLGLGLYRPHSERYIPQKYFPEDYVNDIYAEPFDIPYNYPVNTFPYNGIVMPPQPEPMYNDYYTLLDGGIASKMADNGGVYDQIETWIDGLTTLPVIDELLTDADREAILFETAKANYQMNYIAAVQYIDAQIGRVMDALNAHPEIKENTIIVLLSDNGYSLGEKRHWTKWTLWEPDTRVPLLIADPSKPGNRVVRQTVTLVDIFPTVCDLADVQYPTKPDGSDYLDGLSLIDLLDGPELQFEYPALTTYKKNIGNGSCYPHHSVRNDRWHYIRYRQNNDGAFGVSYCDSTNVSFEEELYEIGVNRETDPYEWNNLISNPDYIPLVHYLNQWMPDSALYMDRTFKLVMSSVSPDCFAAHDDTLLLTFTIYDTTGLIISPPADYIYKWSNNITDDVMYGETISFDLQLLSDAEYAANERIVFYIEMLNPDNEIVAGFDLQYYFLNGANIPNATFNVINLSGLTVQILDYAITGTYLDTWWDFGDGVIIEETIPAPYTYATPGTYLITNYATYGNDSCVTSFTQNITLDTNITQPEDLVQVFPNPANSHINVLFPMVTEFASVTIYDLAGQEILTNRYLNGNYGFTCKIDISDFKQGMYLLNLQTAEVNSTTPFVVVR